MCPIFCKFSENLRIYGSNIGYQSKSTVMRDEDENLAIDAIDILNMCKKYLDKLLYKHD